MNGLRAYAERRLELGDMIRATLHLARACGDTESEEQARDLLARLAADRFRLAVVGQFSRGKSTLMNALLGGAYLPMGALPMTSVITSVRYGSQPRAMVRRHHAALPVEVPLGEVADFVASSSVRRAEMRVANVEVEVPAEILRLGFEFADTPGVGSALAGGTATTRQFLPQADAVIFVTGFDSPLTETEAGFLADASRQAGKLFLVLNKRDLVGDRDAVGVYDFVRRRVHENLGIAEPRFFGLSALEALEGVLRGDPNRLSASGLPSLRAALEEFLIADKTRLFLDNIASRAAVLADRRRQDLRLGELAEDNHPGVPEVLTAFEARVSDLGSQQSAAAARIAGQADGRLPDLLAERSAAWQADLRELLAPAAHDALGAIKAGEPVRVALESARGRLEQAGRDATGSWVRRRAGEVHELITRLAADDIDALLSASRSPRAIAARIAGLTSGDHQRLAGWTAEDLPEVTVRPPEWNVAPGHPPRLRRKTSPGDPEVRHQLADALTAAIASFEQRARVRFQEAAVDWAGRLENQARRQLGESAEYVRRCLRTPPQAEELGAADDLAARLDGFRATLRTGSSPGSEDRPGRRTADELPAREPEQHGECVVCLRLEETLGERLRRDQFLLATRESDQDRHTRARGYCPLHTWQYASIASPLGISAGYGKLAAAVAAELRSASESDLADEELSQAVAALTPGPGDCALCKALAARERAAIAEAVAGSADGALCLRHLAQALAAGATPRVARKMLRETAAVLSRDSESMRDYALKREALQHWRVTDEESRAHLDALRRLAGRSSLTAPWTDLEA